MPSLPTATSMSIFQPGEEAVKNHLIQTRGHVAMHLQQAKELETTGTVRH